MRNIAAEWWRQAEENPKLRDTSFARITQEAKFLDMFSIFTRYPNGL